MNKILLKVTIIGTVAFFATLAFLQFGYCQSIGMCVGFTKSILSQSPGYLSFFVAALLITAQSNLYKREISRSFAYFSLIWVLISIVLSQILGQGHGGWITTSPRPEGIFFLMMVIYLFIGSVWQFVTKGR